MSNELPSTLDHRAEHPRAMGDSVLFALGNIPTSVHLQREGETLEFQPVDDTRLSKSRYLFEGEIARGGMGAVLRCWDQDLGREIAVKVILENHRGKTELVQRFVEEAQIAGQLQHPGIAPVYELGSFPDMRPYFSMKLIRGETLAKLFKERANPMADRPKYLKIFEQICQTVAYAHARGVIHRDLKPLNVMVGAFGEVQVMDWGLAKVLKKSGLEHGQGEGGSGRPEKAVQTQRSSGQSSEIPKTQAGAVSGTPGYMAPEQARGEIDQLDERADVFGLGAILCELLTGQPAYHGKSALDVLRQAAAAELDDALARLEQSGTDAELIALGKCCLAPKREDRPRHAGELASRLTRYLNSVEDRLKRAELSAVEARTKAEEERKRRQVTFRMAAGILIAVLTGLGISLWQMNRAMVAEGLAQKNETQAKMERDEKETARSDAVKSANAERLAKEQTQKRLVQIRKGIDLLGSIFNDLDPRRIAREGDKMELVLGKRLVTAGDQLDGELIGDPVVVAELQSTLGAALQNMGQYPQAISLHEKSWKTRVKELGEQHHDTLKSQTNLADSYRAAGKLDQAIPLQKKSYQQLTALLGKHHEDTLAAASNLAAGLETIGKKEQAITLLKDALEIAKKHLVPNHVLTLQIMNNLAVCYRSTGKVELAIPLYREAFEGRKTKLGAHHPATLTTRDNLSEAYLERGQVKLALPLMEESMKHAREKLGHDHPDTLSSMNNLAHAYREAGQLEKSLKMHEAILPLRTAKLGADHPDTLGSMNNLALMYRIMGQLEKATTLFDAALKLKKKKLGVNHPDTLMGMGQLAAVYREAGKLDQAIPLMKETLEGMKKVNGAEHPHTIITMNNLAKAYLDDKKLDQAMPLFLETLELNKKVFGTEHPNTLTTMNNLSVAYQTAGKLDLAYAIAEETLKKRRKTFGIKHPDTLSSMNNLAGMLDELGKLQESIQLYAEVAEVAKEVWGRTHPSTIHVTRNYLKTLEKDKQWVKSAKARQDLLVDERQVYIRDDAQLVRALVSTGYAELKTNQAKEGEGHFREALALQEKTSPQGWQTYRTKSMLGEALLLAKNYAEAEPLLLAGYQGMKEKRAGNLQESLLAMKEAALRLVRLYEAMGKKDDAARWVKESEQYTSAPR